MLMATLSALRAVSPSLPGRGRPLSSRWSDAAEVQFVAQSDESVIVLTRDMAMRPA